MRKENSREFHKREHELSLVITEDTNFEGKFIVTGFHGLGGIGHLTVRYLVESGLRQKKARKIGYLIGRTMPPFVEVLQDGSFGNPYELFELGNAIFLLIRFQPFLEEQAVLADILTHFARERKISGIILLGGIDINAFENAKNPPIVYIANKFFMDSWIDNLKRAGIPAAPKGIYVTGGVALILSYATHRNIPAVALFAPTEKGIINRQAALALAKKIKEFLNLPVDLMEIEEELRTAEEVLRKMQEKLTKATVEAEKKEDLSQLFT